LDDNDLRLIPVLECLTSVLSVIGMEAQAYVSQIYTRCMRLLGTILHPNHSHISLSNLEDEGDADNSAFNDFIICSLDVISALCEGMNTFFPALVNESVERLFELMFVSMSDTMPEVRQSGFSLSGEICKSSFVLINQPRAAKMMELILQNLNTGKDIDYSTVAKSDLFYSRLSFGM
jgi:hypothetical protein